jgi:hypothetical protein
MPNDTGPNPNTLEPELDALRVELREEAAQLKECFTKYAFQTVAISAALLGLIVRYLWEIPQVGLAAIAPAMISLACCRLGTFKYAAANRCLGYELHLFRTRSVPESLQGRWNPDMRWMGWEEGLRAWRVVQTTIFANVYIHSRFWPNFVKPGFQNKAVWWCQKSMIRQVKGVHYHPGMYLKTMLLLLHILAWFSWLVVFAMVIRAETKYGAGAQLNLSIFACVALFVVVLLRTIMDTNRRDILEDGLLSIHSCAIVWQVVAIAHYTAKEKATKLGPMEHESKKVDGSGFEGYSVHLANQAKEVSQELDNIYRWIGRSPENNSERTTA